MSYFNLKYRQIFVGTKKQPKGQAYLVEEKKFPKYIQYADH